MDHGTVLRSAPEKQVDNVEYNEHTEFTVMAIRGDNLDPNAEKKLVRKIDLFLLPCIWIVYLLSYMDRSNLGNARVAGMGDDLGITDDTYYLAVVLFQVGYVIAEIPCNMILSRSRPSIFLPIIMVFWGAICILIGIVKTWEQLVGLRFVLGIAEAGFSPAVMFIVSSWYRKHEQSKRFMVFHSAGVASGAFGSIIAGAITSGMEGTRDIEGWRWLFIIEGAITIACAFAVPFVLLDYPLTSKKLSPDERQMAYDRLIADGITSRNDNSEPLSHLRALKKAVTDWRLLPLVLGYMTIIGSMSLAYFYPTFTAELGYSRKDAQYMTAPIYGVALVVAIVLCILADIVPELRAIFTSSVLIVFGTVFAALSTSIFKPTARYVFLCFINTAVWAANPLSLSYTSTVLGPVHPEVRAICLAIVNGFANLAQLYGTYIFTASEPPEYRMGFAVYSAIFAIGSLIYLASFFIFRKWPFKG
ncbi:MFS general substrate transporter [Hortaea werneckii]|nr:MFS general substrate transporter [Hortaea werneckii]